MQIAVDAMGSDAHPAPDVEGAVMAARECDDQIILVGHERNVRMELEKYAPAPPNLKVIHAEQHIEMGDRPVNAARHKPLSSMHIGMGLVRDGIADAFVTMGNTGAAQVIAMLFTLGRIRGVKRPALSAIFPLRGKSIVFVDVGANAESRPEWLAQFGLMGAIYAENALGLSNARVGLLSNGEEEGKGTEIVREANALMKALPVRFIGNIEPKEIFAGAADVVVADGFTGNLLVKTYEASTRYIANVIREEVRSDLLSMIGGLLLRPALSRVRRKIDTFEVGGAPLLGVRGVVIIGHGRSNAIAVKNAIHQARRAVDGRIISAITEKIALVNPLLSGRVIEEMKVDHGIDA
jgi:glycerol-3-phosphate acyltransferase PlsX